MIHTHTRATQPCTQHAHATQAHVYTHVHMHTQPTASMPPKAQTHAIPSPPCMCINPCMCTHCIYTYTPPCIYSHHVYASMHVRTLYTHMQTHALHIHTCAVHNPLTTPPHLCMDTHIHTLMQCPQICTGTYMVHRSKYTQLHMCACELTPLHERAHTQHARGPYCTAQWEHLGGTRH